MTLLVLLLAAAVIRLWIVTGRLSRRVAQLEAGVASGRIVPAPTVAPKERPALGPAPAWGPGEASAPVAVPTAAAPIGAEPPPRSEPVGADALRWARSLGPWLRANWIYAVAAASLALAGVFLVQYGAERGLLSPGLRVLAGLGLGAALIAGGEVIRRRWGDEEESSSAVLPSTLSSAGIVVLYAVILAARGLYGLIGPELAFAGLAGVSVLALVFGWFYGPFLAAAGIVGAMVAPFLVGGSGGNGALLLGYFGLVATASLAVDAVRRWGWVSALALALAYGASLAVQGALPAFEAYAALLLWLAMASVAIPRLELVPTHPGPSLAAWALSPRREPGPRPVAPTWIAAGGVAASSALLLLAAAPLGAGAQLLALLLLAGLAVLLILWGAEARGIEDLALVPTALLLIGTTLAGIEGSALARAFHGATGTPWAASLVLLGATAVSGAAWARSLRDPRGAIWAAAAALVAPAMAAALELAWRPAEGIGPWPWALHVMGLAALMTLWAVRYAALDGEDRRRAAYGTLSALSLIALAVFVLLSDAALTVALSALVAVAAGLDRRFRLPEMGWFILAGIAALGWRLTVAPGLPAYLIEAPLVEAVLAFGAALLGLGTARALLPPGREAVRAAIESAALAVAAVFASVLAWRGIDGLSIGRADGVLSHWSFAILGLIWTALALAQSFRASLGGPLRRLRQGLAVLEAGFATLAFLLVLVVFNPLLGFDDRVLGPWPLDTVLLAYGGPALLLGLAAARARWLGRLRPGLAGAAALFGVLWTFLAIRGFWQDDLALDRGFSQPELLSYTGALLLAGGVLLYQALATRSDGLRRLAMGIIGVAIAKVFLVDAAGLAGLLRVVSFLGLGLVLAGLAWLNRWAVRRQGAA